MKTIYIVDDNLTNLGAAKEALGGLYRTFAMQSAEKMFSMLKKIRPDLILLDINMPDMDGFEAIKMLKSEPIYSDIPIIFITSISDPQIEVKGFDLGAVDFILKPFAIPTLRRRIQLQISTDVLIKEAKGELRHIQNAMLGVIADLVENRDSTTGAHIERTQIYLGILLDRLKETGVYATEVSKWDIELMLPSAQLHDIGKISIPDAILNKPGKLSDEEFAVMKTHALKGEAIIDEIMEYTNDDGFLEYAKFFAGFHHEKWDGGGYPYGLSGNDIPLQGRIMAIADVYDALTSTRPYKEALPHEKAVEIIVSESGTHFDPVLVKEFLAAADEFEKVSRKSKR
ncbi:MAG: response regulator [Ruminococcus sp.]|jgi:putative two-component system response regulator|nr:response regulator [Ruminococcus sp.]